MGLGQFRDRGLEFQATGDPFWKSLQYSSCGCIDNKTAALAQACEQLGDHRARCKEAAEGASGSKITDKSSHNKSLAQAQAKHQRVRKAFLLSTWQKHYPRCALLVTSKVSNPCLIEPIAPNFFAPNPGLHCLM